MRRKPASKIIRTLALVSLVVALSSCSTTTVSMQTTGSLFATATAALVQSLPTMPPTPTPAVAAGVSAPTGQIVFVSDRDGTDRLYTMNGDGTNQRLLVPDGGEPETPRWSPDGTRIAYVATQKGNKDIYILDLATSQISRLTDSPARDDAPSWSPDSKHIAFESFRDGNLEIYAVNADGSGLLRLTDDPAGDTRPTWSPDGTSIAFMSNRNGQNSVIYRISPDGKGLAQLTHATFPQGDPVWSPNGTLLAFRSFQSSNAAEICIMDRSGGDTRCLTTNSQWQNGIPAWSPDGRFLAFRSRRLGRSGIDVVNVSDGSLKSIALTIPMRGDPLWSPDGAWLAFQGCPATNTDQTCANIPDMEIYAASAITQEIRQLTATPGYNGQVSWAGH